MNLRNKRYGFILLFRSLRKHWLYPRNRSFTTYEAWIEILFEVNHAPKKVAIGNQVLICDIGESLNSIGTWADMFNWTESKVRRFFDKLSNDEMIVYKGDSGTTRLKVLNYEGYHNRRRVIGKQMKNERRLNGEHLKTNNNVNKNNNGNNDNIIIINTQKYFNNEIKQNNDIVDQKTLIGYGRFVGTILNANGCQNLINEPAMHILRIKKQLSLSEYIELKNEARKRDVQLFPMLERWINVENYSKGKISVYATLKTWIEKAPIVKNC